MAARKPKYDATFTPMYKIDLDILGQKASFSVPIAELDKVQTLLENMVKFIAPPEEKSSIIEAMKDPDAK